MPFSQDSILCFRSCFFTVKGTPGGEETLSAMDEYFSLVTKALDAAGCTLESLTGSIVSGYWTLPDENIGDILARALSTSIDLSQSFMDHETYALGIALELTGAYRWESDSSSTTLAVTLGEGISLCQDYVTDADLRVSNGVVLGPSFRETAEAAGFTKMDDFPLKLEALWRKVNGQEMFLVAQ